MSGLTTRKLGVLASATVLSIVLTTSLSTTCAKAADKIGSDKLGGKDRTGTSISIADKSWSTNWKDGETVIIANGNNDHLVDSLTVAPLAYEKNAPILLTTEIDKIDARIMDKLYTEKIKNVYIVGGIGAISENAEKQLSDAGIKVTRLGGRTRVETAKAINEKLGNTSTVAVVGNDAVADALSIASIASREKMTIVLANDKDTVDIESIKGKNVYAVGGTGVLSDKLVNEIKGKRLGGDTRYETNAKVLKEFDAKLKYNSVYMADGNTLVDALSGSVLAAQTQSPIILVNDSIDNNTKKLIESKAGSMSNIIELGLGIKSNVIEEIKTVVNNVKNKEVITTTPNNTNNKDNSKEDKPNKPNPSYIIKYVLPMENVNLKTGDKYTLPKTVKVKMSDDSEVQVAVIWDKTLDTTKAGEYEFIGTVEGTSKKAFLKVIVKQNLQVEYIFPFQDKFLTVGESYALPQKVKVRMTDKTTKEVELAWNNNVDTNKAGKYELIGSISDSDKKVTLNVTVMELENVKYVVPFEVKHLTVGESYELPKTVQVKILDDSIKELPVAWDQAIDTSKPSEYNLTGNIAGSKKKATLKVIVEGLPVDVEATVDVTLIAETPITVVKGKVKSNSLQGLKAELYTETTNEKVGEAEISSQGEFTISNFTKDLLGSYDIKIVNSKGSVIFSKSCKPTAK